MEAVHDDVFHFNCTISNISLVLSVFKIMAASFSFPKKACICNYFRVSTGGIFHSATNHAK